MSSRNRPACRSSPPGAGRGRRAHLVDHVDLSPSWPPIVPDRRRRYCGRPVATGFGAAGGLAGAGLLSEALAKQGAQVTAIDLAPELVKVARLHGLESGVQVDYRVQAAEDLAAEQPGSFDVVTCMEMLEHVPDPGAIIEACKRLLKPGGHLFLSTINRTAAAFAVAIVGAEYVARLLPKGTHHYQEFIKPAELARWLREADMQLVDVSGMAYEPWRNHARLSSRTDINYLAYAVKPA